MTPPEHSLPETSGRTMERDVERAYQISEAYAIVSAKLGRERLALQQLREQRRQSRGVHIVPQPSDAQIECAVREVAELEEAHDFLRAALVGTKFERITEQQLAALNRGESLTAFEYDGYREPDDNQWQVEGDAGQGGE